MQNVIKILVALCAAGIFLFVNPGFAREGLSPSLRARAAADRIAKTTASKITPLGTTALKQQIHKRMRSAFEGRMHPNFTGVVQKTGDKSDMTVWINTADSSAPNLSFATVEVGLDTPQETKTSGGGGFLRSAVTRKTSRIRPLIPDPGTFTGNASIQKSLCYKAHVTIDEIFSRLKAKSPDFVILNRQMDSDISTVAGWNADRQQRWADKATAAVKGILSKKSRRLEEMREKHPAEVDAVVEAVRKQYQSYKAFLAQVNTTTQTLLDKAQGNQVPSPAVAEALDSVSGVLEPWPSIQAIIRYLRGELPDEEMLPLENYIALLMRNTVENVRLQNIFAFMDVAPANITAGVYYDACRTVYLEDITGLGAGPADIYEIFRIAELVDILEWEAAFTDLVRAKAVYAVADEHVTKGGTTNCIGALLIDSEGRPRRFIPGGGGTSLISNLSVYYYPFRLAEWYRPGDTVVLMFPSLAGYLNFEQLEAYIDDWRTLQAALPGAPEIWAGAAIDNDAFEFYKPVVPADTALCDTIMGELLNGWGAYDKFQEDLEKEIYMPPSEEEIREAARAKKPLRSTTQVRITGDRKARSAKKSILVSQPADRIRETAHHLPQVIEEALRKGYDEELTGRIIRMVRTNYESDFTALARKADVTSDPIELHRDICYVTRIIQMFIGEYIAVSYMENADFFTDARVAGLSGKLSAAESNKPKIEKSDIKDLSGRINSRTADLIREIRRHPDIFPAEIMPAVEPFARQWAAQQVTAAAQRPTYRAFKIAWDEARAAAKDEAAAAHAQDVAKARQILSNARELIELVGPDDGDTVHNCVNNSAEAIKKLDPAVDPDKGLIRELQGLSAQLIQKFEKLYRLAHLSDKQQTAKYLLTDRKFERMRAEADPDTRQALELLNAIFEDRPYKGKEKPGRLAKKLEYAARGRGGDPLEFYQTAAALAQNYPALLQKALVASILRPLAAGEENGRAAIAASSSEEQRRLAKLRDIYTDKKTDAVIIILADHTAIVVENDGSIKYPIPEPFMPALIDILITTSRNPDPNIATASMLAIAKYEMEITAQKLYPRGNLTNLKTAIMLINIAVNKVNIAIEHARKITMADFSSRMTGYMEKLPTANGNTGNLLSELKTGYDETLDGISGHLRVINAMISDLERGVYNHARCRQLSNLLSRANADLFSDYNAIPVVEALSKRTGILISKLSLLLSCDELAIGNLRDQSGEIDSQVLRPRAAVEKEQLPAVFWWQKKEQNGGLLDPMYSQVRDESDLVGNLAGFEAYARFMVNQGADFLVMLPTCAINPNDPCPYVGLGFFTNNAIGYLDPKEVLGHERLGQYREDFIREILSAETSGKDLPYYFNIMFITDLRANTLNDTIENYLRRRFAEAASGNIVDWPLVMAFNEYCLRGNFFENEYDEASGGLKKDNQRFRQFIEDNKAWVKGEGFSYGIGEYALFHSLFNYHQTSGYDWSGNWDFWENLSDPNSVDAVRQRALAEAREKYKKDIIFYEYAQWQYLERYKKARQVYRRNGKMIVGDLEIYPAHNSATAWALQKLFDTKKTNGAPPDRAGPDGQNWFSPAQKWDEEFEGVMRLWEARIGWGAQFYDGLRIDHVLGIIQEWVIDEGKSALEGGWNLSTNQALVRGEKILRRLAKVARECGILLICEDIGERDIAIKRLLVRLSLELPNFYLYNPVGWRDRQKDAEAAGWGKTPRYMTVEGTADTPSTISQRLEGELNDDDQSRDGLLAFLGTHGIRLPISYRERIRNYKQAEQETIRAIRQEPFYCLTMATVLGNGERHNIPGVPWLQRRANWSVKHPPVTALSALPNLGFFTKGIPAAENPFPAFSRAALEAVLRPLAAGQRNPTEFDRAGFMIRDFFSELAAGHGIIAIIVTDNMEKQRVKFQKEDVMHICTEILWLLCQHPYLSVSDIITRLQNLPGFRNPGEKTDAFVRRMFRYFELLEEFNIIQPSGWDDTKGLGEIYELVSKPAGRPDRYDESQKTDFQRGILKNTAFDNMLRHLNEPGLEFIPEVETAIKQVLSLARQYGRRLHRGQFVAVASDIGNVMRLFQQRGITSKVRLAIDFTGRVSKQPINVSIYFRQPSDSTVYYLDPGFVILPVRAGREIKLREMLTAHFTPRPGIAEAKKTRRKNIAPSKPPSRRTAAQAAVDVKTEGILREAEKPLTVTDMAFRLYQREGGPWMDKISDVEYRLPDGIRIKINRACDKLREDGIIERADEWQLSESHLVRGNQQLRPAYMIKLAAASPTEGPSSALSRAALEGVLRPLAKGEGEFRAAIENLLAPQYN